MAGGIGEVMMMGQISSDCGPHFLLLDYNTWER